jgi:hypothetical protein
MCVFSDFSIETNSKWGEITSKPSLVLYLFKLKKKPNVSFSANFYNINEQFHQYSLLLFNPIFLGLEGCCSAATCSCQSNLSVSIERELGQGNALAHLQIYI